MDRPEIVSETMRRLSEKLTVQANDLGKMRAWIEKMGYTPDSELWRINERMISDNIAYRAVIQYVLHTDGVYRPGVDPYKRRGLSAQLKPEFKLRGIEDR